MTINRLLPLTAGVALLAVAALSAVAEVVEFTNFSPLGSDFYVSFPGKFQQIADKKSDKGIIEKTYISQIPTRKTFIVGYVFIPRGVFPDTVATNQVLETILKTTQLNNAKTRTQRRFIFKEAAAVELVADVETTPPTVGKRRLYVKRDKGGNVREYQLIFTGAPGLEESPEAARFFDSFRFD